MQKVSWRRGFDDLTHSILRLFNSFSERSLVPSSCGRSSPLTRVRPSTGHEVGTFVCWSWVAKVKRARGCSWAMDWSLVNKNGAVRFVRRLKISMQKRPRHSSHLYKWREKQRVAFHGTRLRVIQGTFIERGPGVLLASTWLVQVQSNNLTKVRWVCLNFVSWHCMAWPKVPPPSWNDPECFRSHFPFLQIPILPGNLLEPFDGLQPAVEISSDMNFLVALKGSRRSWTHRSWAVDEKPWNFQPQLGF